MKVNAYLNFNGDCEQAFKFYEQTLGGKIMAMFRHAGTPAAEHVPAEWQNKILHVTLSIPGQNGAEQLLMGSDTPPERYSKPKGFCVSLNFDKIPDAEGVFQALAENGSVDMPLQQTFFAARFGLLRDRFGIPWMINCAPPAA